VLGRSRTTLDGYAGWSQVHDDEESPRGLVVPNFVVRNLRSLELRRIQIRRNLARDVQQPTCTRVMEPWRVSFNAAA